MHGQGFCLFICLSFNSVEVTNLWKPRDKVIKHLEALPFHSTGTVCRTLMSVQISAFSACYKQLNVLHLQCLCLILFLQLPVLMEAWGLHFQGTDMSEIREMAVWLNSDTAKHKTSCCWAPFLPVLIPSPAFHSVLITLNELSKLHPGRDTEGGMSTKCTYH